MSVSTYRSPLAPDALCHELAALLQRELRSFSIDPLRPTESRAVVRTRHRQVWVLVLSTRQVQASFALCGSVTPTGDGGSVLTIRRRSADAYFWLPRVGLLALAAMFGFVIVRAGLEGPGPLVVALAFTGLAVLVGAFSERLHMRAGIPAITAVEAAVTVALQKAPLRRETA